MKVGTAAVDGDEGGALGGERVEEDVEAPGVEAVPDGETGRGRTFATTGMADTCEGRALGRLL